MSLESYDLLAVAKDLLNSPHRTDAHTARAVSTAYYAIFHHTCCSAGNLLTGNSSKTYLTRAKTHLQRSIDHNNLCKRCRSAQDEKLGFPKEVVQFANTLFEAYEYRISADYDPFHEISETDAQTLVGKVEDAMKEFDGLHKRHRVAFFIWALMDQRKSAKQ